MEVIETGFSHAHEAVAFKMDSGHVLFFGPNVVPGTDVPTFRFTYGGSIPKEERAQMIKSIKKYCKEKGFSAPLDFFNSKA
jgi:hypothetical protein